MNWSKWTLVKTFSIRFCSLFHCFRNFAKGTNLFFKASVWYMLLLKRPIYTSESNQWILLWWAKFELQCLPIVSFSIQNCKKQKKNKQLNKQKWGLGMSVYLNSFRRKSLKFVLFQSPFSFFFSHQNSWTKLLVMN